VHIPRPSLVFPTYSFHLLPGILPASFSTVSICSPLFRTFVSMTFSSLPRFFPVSSLHFFFFLTFSCVVCVFYLLFRYIASSVFFFFSVCLAGRHVGLLAVSLPVILPLLWHATPVRRTRSFLPGDFPTPISPLNSQISGHPPEPIGLLRTFLFFFMQGFRPFS